MDQRLPFPCSARVQRDIQPRNHVGFITAGCRCPRVLSLWLAGRGNEACAAGGARPLVEGGCCRFGGHFASRRKDVVFVSGQETPPPPGKGRLDPSGRSVCAWLPCVRGDASNPSPQSRSAGRDPRRPSEAGRRAGEAGAPRPCPSNPSPARCLGRQRFLCLPTGFCALSCPCPRGSCGESRHLGRVGSADGVVPGVQLRSPPPPRSPGPPHAAVSEPSAVFHAKLQLSPTGEVKFRSITCLC